MLMYWSISLRTGQEGPELEPGVVEEEGGAADSVLGNIVDAIKAPLIIK